MKRYLITLLILFTLFDRAYGQSPSAAIDSLAKFKVITGKEKLVLEQSLKRKSNIGSYRVTILWGLQITMLQKKFHVNNRKTGFFISYGDSGFSPQRQDSANKSLHILLQKINKAGLLSNAIYTQTSMGIDSNRYIMDVQLIGQLAEVSMRMQLLAPRKLLPIAEELYKTGVVSDSAYFRLQGDIKNGKIESSFQLSNYCLHSWIFNSAKYANTDTVDVWMKQVHTEVAALLPGLNFSDFSFAVESNSLSGCLPEIQFKISLTCNGRIYKYNNSAYSYSKEMGTSNFNNILAINFYRIFNKILSDQQSPFRFHYMMYSYGIAPDDNTRRFAVVALKVEQTEMFRKDPCMSYMLTSMENYDNTFTSARIDSVIGGWKTLGLFTHLSTAEINKGIDDTEAGERISINRLLLNFPGVIYSLDSSMMEPYPYETILTHLGKITHGEFNPIRVFQKSTGKANKLQYMFKGKIHSYTFHAANGWLDNGFPLFLKHLGVENNLAGRFYQFAYDNAVIYLTKRQHGYAVAHRLLDFAR